MAILRKVGNSTEVKRISPSSVSTATRTDFVEEYRETGGKTSGTVVKLQGGVQFRKSTNLTRYNSRIVRGAANTVEGVRSPLTTNPGTPIYVRTSDGGFFGDEILRPGMAPSVKGDSINGSLNSPNIPIMMQNEAVTKALLKLADQKAGIGEDLATFRQTLRMIQNPAKSLTRAIRMIKDHDAWMPWLKHSARSLARKGVVDRSAEAYLMYVYGLKPLMQDIYGIIEFAKETGLNPLLLHSTASSRRQSTIGAFDYNNISANTMTKLKGGQEDIRVNCSLWAQLDPNWQGLRALNQLGLANPLALSWELVTLSFVIDWFVPVGPVLQALMAPAGLVFVDGTVSVRTRANAPLESWYYGFDSNLTYKVNTNNHATCQWSYDGYKRSRLTNWPLPGLWIDPDPLRLNAGNSDRAFKAMALAIVNLRW